MTAVTNHLAKCSAISLQQPLQVTGTGTTNGTGQDVSALEGIVLVVLDANYVSGTSTLDVKLQECDTVGGTYTDITGAAFTQVAVADSVQTLKLDIGSTKKFVRSVGVAAGTSPVYTWGVSLIGMPKYS